MTFSTFWSLKSGQKVVSKGVSGNDSANTGSSFDRH